MLGKILVAILLAIGVGIVLQLTPALPLQAIGAALLLIGGGLLGLVVLVALVYALEGVIFRASSRRDRFN